MFCDSLTGRSEVGRLPRRTAYVVDCGVCVFVEWSFAGPFVLANIAAESHAADVAAAVAPVADSGAGVPAPEAAVIDVDVHSLAPAAVGVLVLVPSGTNRTI